MCLSVDRHKANILNEFKMYLSWSYICDKSLTTKLIANYFNNQLIGLSSRKEVKIILCYSFFYFSLN